jgi:hypothetical protein
MRSALVPTHAMFAATLFLALSQPPASAQPLETMSNDLRPDWQHWWVDHDAWEFIPTYSDEPSDHLGGGVDYVTIAHDNFCVYFYVEQSTPLAFEPGNQLIFFDVDLNAATGTNENYAWNKPIAVGAEYTLNGGSIVATSNPANATVDEWYYVDPLHTGGNYDYLIKIAREKLGNPAAFDWDMTILGGEGHDYYPDFNNYHRYVIETSAAYGDFNGDGRVNGVDLNDPAKGWKARFGADLTGADFLVWQRHVGLGRASLAASTATPEPATGLLALVSVAAWRAARRRVKMASLNAR